jgi:4-hydroxy-3-methylbut-2-enyl diphosphate reductase
LVQNLVQVFRDRGTTDIGELEVIQENMRFMLPKEIRTALADNALPVAQ